MAQLTKLATHLDVPARTQVLHGTPSRAITGFAERLPASLIAMATHGQTGLTSMFMGSVATEVVRHAHCPILIMRPPMATQACLDEA